MVSLARVLLRDMSVLLIDEPTKGLAPKLVTEVADVLAEVARTTRSSSRTSRSCDASPTRWWCSTPPGRAPGWCGGARRRPTATRELLGVSMRREGAA